MTMTTPATPPAPAVGRPAPADRAIVAAAVAAELARVERMALGELWAGNAAGAEKALAWARPMKAWLRREESRP